RTKPTQRNDTKAKQIAKGIEIHPGAIRQQRPQHHLRPQTETRRQISRVIKRTEQHKEKRTEKVDGIGAVEWHGNQPGQRQPEEHTEATNQRHRPLVELALVRLVEQTNAGCQRTQQPEETQSQKPGQQPCRTEQLHESSLIRGGRTTRDHFQLILKRPSRLRHDNVNYLTLLLQLM